MLKQRRTSRRLSLRDLSTEIGVSLNTLSRVERGHVPDLKNFHRIVEWLDVPADSFFSDGSNRIPTPEAIARHLRSDRALSADDAAQIARVVEEMYRELASDRLPLKVHLRSARTFTPAAAKLLSEILHDMHRSIDATLGK